MTSWWNVGYALTCVLVPVVWGLVVVWISNRIERRMLGRTWAAKGHGKRRSVRPIEYHI